MIVLLLYLSLFRKKSELENEKEGLNQQLQQKDEEMKKVKKELLENREKLKETSEVRNEYI